MFIRLNGTKTELLVTWDEAEAEVGSIIDNEVVGAVVLECLELVIFEDRVKVVVGREFVDLDDMDVPDLDMSGAVEEPIL